MFAPCDLDGNIMREYITHPYDKDKVQNINTLLQAQERVLFEDVYGIEYIENIILDRCNTIEDLLSLKIVYFELTKSAQKQLGL